VLSDVFRLRWAGGTPCGGIGMPPCFSMWWPGRFRTQNDRARTVVGMLVTYIWYLDEGKGFLGLLVFGRLEEIRLRVVGVSHLERKHMLRGPSLIITIPIPFCRKDNLPPALLQVESGIRNSLLRSDQREPFASLYVQSLPRYYYRSNIRCTSPLQLFGSCP
jgi:hypothetical protein